ncbi:polysaccharide biosynthesis protein [Psychromarinibacter sp. S121]|uniref:polysaccharide biosynthesis protein n=1 Tax=Psychromarinibacter sp. S121 TaxID=3415127 RepID=UPI003C7DE799
MLGVDLVLVPAALFLTLGLQQQGATASGELARAAPMLGLLMVLGTVLSLLMGIPKIQLKAYDLSGIGRTAVFAMAMAMAAGGLGSAAGLGYASGVYIVFGLVFFLLSAASRMILLQILWAIYRGDRPRRRVLIYGAGTTGVQLASALRTHETIEPVAFTDDNAGLQGMTILGLPVYKPARIPEIVRKRRIDRVLLAMPSLSLPKQTQILREMEKLGVEVQALPSFAQLIGEEELIDKLSPIMPGHFLGREKLDDQMQASETHYAGRTVLVSGAGGSIGSELCRQVLACGPKRLVLYELSELALYQIEMELQLLAESSETEIVPEIVPVLGSVTDARLVRKTLGEQAVDVVLHAAAYKHVPMVEANPLAGLANNVLGTATLAREAQEAGVERFVLISSDKAVRPTNVMGASKRLAELVVQDLAARAQGTVFAMVRFGNVLGSSGSVIPLFQEQIARGGPVTLTDPRVTRYFMTVQEAVGLVLQAGGFARGGEVFVLDMGEPVLIAKLARQMIEASGYTVRDTRHPDGDIEIRVTGLRPGEKLHEELIIGEGFLTTAHEKIFAAREARLSEIEVASALRGLRSAVAAADDDAARALVARWVEGYGPDHHKDGDEASTS